MSIDSISVDSISVDSMQSGGRLCYCRAGFETELAAQLTERAALADCHGHARTTRNDGYVLFEPDMPHPGDCAPDAGTALSFSRLIFARQKLRLHAGLAALDPRDRIGPILSALHDHAAPGSPAFGALLVEHPDSDSGKPLAGLARSFGNALDTAAPRAGFP